MAVVTVTVSGLTAVSLVTDMARSARACIIKPKRCFAQGVAVRVVRCETYVTRRIVRVVDSTLCLGCCVAVGGGWGKETRLKAAGWFQLGLYSLPSRWSRGEPQL